MITMCFHLFANISCDLRTFSKDIEELTANLELIFYAHGVVIPFIVSLGVTFNILGLFVLCRKQFRGSPYSLLWYLCACDCCILIFSIYSDTEPAIRSKIQIDKFNSEFQLSCESIFSMSNHFTNTSLNVNSKNALGIDFLRENQNVNVNESNNSIASQRVYENRTDGKNVFINLTNSETIEDTNKMLLLLLMKELRREATRDKSKPLDSEVHTSRRSPVIRNSTASRSKEQSNKSHKPVDVTDKIISTQPSSTYYLPYTETNLKESKSFQKETKSSDANSLKHNLNQFLDKENWQEKMTDKPDKSQRPIEVRIQGSGAGTSRQSSSSRRNISSHHDMTAVTPTDSPLSFPSNTTFNSTSTNGESKGITINSKPVLQATERWVANSLLTFNLGLTLALAGERCLAVACPFRAATWLTVSKSRLLVVILVVLTIVLHTPQYLKEVVLAVTSPELVQDDFRGKMLQAFRIDYERIVVYLSSFSLHLLLALNLALVIILRRYKVKFKYNRQPGNQANVDVNVTMAIVAIVFLQLPHNIAMNILATMSLEGFKANVTSFTRAVVIIRVLYVTSSAVHCLIYCLLSRRFRAQLKTILGPCAQCRGQNNSYFRSEPNSLRQCMTSSCCMRRPEDVENGDSNKGPSSSSTPMRQTSMTSLNKSHITSSVSRNDRLLLNK